MASWTWAIPKMAVVVSSGEKDTADEAGEGRERRHSEADGPVED
jgi:hypothetical protein